MNPQSMCDFWSIEFVEFAVPLSTSFVPHVCVMLITRLISCRGIWKHN